MTGVAVGYDRMEVMVTETGAPCTSVHRPVNGISAWNIFDLRGVKYCLILVVFESMVSVAQSARASLTDWESRQLDAVGCGFESHLGPIFFSLKSVSFYLLRFVVTH